MAHRQVCDAGALLAGGDVAVAVLIAVVALASLRRRTKQLRRGNPRLQRRQLHLSHGRRPTKPPHLRLHRRRHRALRSARLECMRQEKREEGEVEENESYHGSEKSESAGKHYPHSPRLGMQCGRMGGTRPIIHAERCVPDPKTPPVRNGSLPQDSFAGTAVTTTDGSARPPVTTRGERLAADCLDATGRRSALACGGDRGF